MRTILGASTWGTGFGCQACAAPHVASPHPGELVDYNVAPGGALTLDPAADYYSVGYEVGEAFDETLISFNGTDSGQTYQNFVPEAATCVPGSPLCTKLYGSTLVSGNNYTFAIDPAAQFYDPSTGAHRGIYPSDVMFSIIRAIFYTQVETVTGYYVGFDIAGPLVPYAGLSPNDVNASWDLGVGGAPIHYPYNNTPSWTLNSMHVNDSAFCPSAALSANGCITFNAGADNEAWGAFLQIMGIISAAGLQSAGWYTAQGADVPGFVCTSADAPCLLPGGATATTQAAFINAVAAMSPTLWDPEEQAGVLNYPDPVPAVGFNEVGSGPYYLDYANAGVGYVLKANPDYAQPTGCAGQVGCLPAKGAYAGDVIAVLGLERHHRYPGGRSRLRRYCDLPDTALPVDAGPDRPASSGSSTSRR